MTVRKCQTCKHYEPSPIWRKGWCRNPRLYSPQQSHLVGQDDLDCSRGLGSFWEAADPPLGEDGERDEAPVASETANGRHPLRLFAGPPRLATAVAGMMSSSTSGGRTGPEGEPGAAPSGRTGGPAGGGLPNYTGPSRPNRPRVPPEQERAVSYQPEERYWTDYLRIALPVVGLLLMLGLFWFWAASLIRGNDSGKSPTKVPQAAVQTIAAAPSPTPANTPVIQMTPTPPAAVAPTPPPAQTNNPPAAASTAPPAASTAGASSGGQFTAGEPVVTTEDQVCFRSEASTSGDCPTYLPQGTELTVMSGPTSAEGYEWYKVQDVNGDTGYVAGNFLTNSQ